MTRTIVVADGLTDRDRGLTDIITDPKPFLNTAVGYQPKSIFFLHSNQEKTTSPPHSNVRHNLLVYQQQPRPHLFYFPYLTDSDNEQHFCGSYSNNMEIYPISKSPTLLTNPS